MIIKSSTKILAAINSPNILSFGIVSLSDADVISKLAIALTSCVCTIILTIYEAKRKNRKR